MNIFNGTENFMPNLSHTSQKFKMNVKNKYASKFCTELCKQNNNITNPGSIIQVKSWTSCSILGCCKPLFSLLNDRQLNTLALGKRNPWFGALSNGEHIAQAGGELMASGILNMNCLKASLMLLPVLDYSNSASVPSSSDHYNISHIKLDVVYYLVIL